MIDPERFDFPSIFGVVKSTDGLKRNQTSDDTVGQLLRYMSIIEEDKKDTNVKGVIVAAKFDERLKYALKKVNGAEAFLYEVDFNIKEFK